LPDAALPLIRTKLHAPRRRRGVVERPRLRPRVDGDDQPALTLVSAPAGFGKTTVVAEWFADDPRTAWLSLDRRDDDPVVFWRYVVAALDTADPRAGAGAGALLGSGPVPVEAVVATLLNDVAALDDGVVLVLDDYHVIGSTAIHESVALLVEHLPPQLRLVLVTRADPPLPLAALRARGELHEVRAADLRFTVDEAASYLTGVMDLQLRQADVDLLGARTEGWIAALQLAALSMQGRDDVGAFIADFSGDDRFILDYLVGEVLQQQGDDVTTFLLETSVLQRLTGGLCDAVTGRADGRAMLERLERANLFLVPLDDRREWYRYHHLFADALRARLLDERGGAVAELHRRASDWWGDQGDPAEAVSHAMAAGDPERAAKWIELAAPAMRLARQESTLRAWLEALPAELFTDRPVLALSLVGARMATGDPAGTEPLLALAEASVGPGAESIAFDAEELATAPAQIAVYRAGLALLAGDVDGTVRHATDVLAVADPTDHYRRGAASALIGLAEWRTGAIEAARDRYVVAVESFRASGHLPDLLGCSVALADLQLAQGRLGDAEATYAAGLRLTAEHPGLRGAADVHVGLAEVLLEHHDLDAAAAHLDAAVALGEGAGLPQHAYRRRVVAALLHQARGELDAAAALLDEAEPVYDTDFSPDVRPIPALRARLQLAGGHVDAAARWAAGRGLAADDDLSYVSEFEHVTLARALVERGVAARDLQVLAEAEGLLDRLLVAADAGGRTGTAIEVLVLLTRARAAAGRSAEAGDLLADALGRAAPETHLRPFVDGGEDLGRLLRALAGPDAAGRLAEAALAARAGGAAPSRPVAGSIDGLSERELDVLRLLRSDLSGPDIARELHVSLNTFRTHTKNIYAKLGVNNRREAVSRATELRI
jgi:LuxR family maltose regulon positive regulatory protein